MFQFQYGTIKSIVLGLVGIREPCFNSNMVRLKDISHFEEIFLH